MEKMMNFLFGLVLMAAGAALAVVGFGAMATGRHVDTPRAEIAQPDLGPLAVGKRFRMRNGSVTSPLEVSARGGWQAWVVEGWHTSGAEWTKDGLCIGGSTTFSNDLSQFDIDSKHKTPRLVTYPPIRG
jgi:hypothetical protein